jgi:heptosyltransferase I
MSLDFQRPPAELCLIRLSAIGDCCHTVPVVRAIQDAWPETRISWVIGKTEHGLLGGMDGVEFVVLDKSRGMAGYAAVREALAGHEFPLLLHMHASARANIVSLLVKAPIKLGFDRVRARDNQWLFSNQRIPARASRHVMDGLFEFGEALGIAHGPPRWDLPLAESDWAFADKHVQPGTPTLVVSPCTGQRFRNYRNWSVERYAHVIDYAARHHGARVVLTGANTPVEQEYASGIKQAAKTKPVNLIGRSSLKQLAALIARASVVLCPDSGPAHMATAMGTPVVGLYATSNRFRTGPYSSQDLVVDKYPQAVEKEFGKPVEALRWGQRVRDSEAMMLITVEDVIEKLDQAFERAGQKSP